MFVQTPGRIKGLSGLGLARVRSRTRIAVLITISLLVVLLGASAADARRKLVALTFDGGPSGYTPKIDRILQRKHVRSTFFWVGSRIDGWERMVKRASRQGHEIANHSWFHDDLTGLPAGAIRHQLARTNRLIARLTGKRPRIFRPPYGAVNPKVRRVAGDLRMRTVTWDVDSVDWTSPGCEQIVAKVRREVRPRAIVLLHDGGGNRTQTVCALPRIIHDLRARGYRFATVSKVLRKKRRGEVSSLCCV
jgi:peptidoglycan/xylan/chitin deacetylase (PgdA/CDA1 family)